MLDDIDVKELIDNRTKTVAPISVGITWVDGRIFTGKDGRKLRAYYGICHYADGIFLLTPLDWEKATTLTTILVDPYNKYCEHGTICLNFKCKLNKFTRGEFERFFGTTAFTLGLPQNLGAKDLWFNERGSENVWKGLALKPEGGVLKFNENAAKKDLII